MKLNSALWFKFRVFLILGGLIVSFSLILFRAFQIQVVRGNSLGELASRQHSTTIEIPSQRGAIYDRNLNELAVSLDVDSVYAVPGRVERGGKAVTLLTTVLAMNKREVLRRLDRPGQFVWLKRQVDLPERHSSILAGIDGIGTMRESRRFYPNGQLASNLIGFAGVDSRGLEGIEFYYDGFLRGASRKVVVQKDARGGEMVFEDVAAARLVRGMDVVLTVDKNVQYIAEKALSRAVEGSHASGGVAIVMAPASGEILAMAVLPTFDPNRFGSYGPGRWRNRAATDMFEPGSTMKIFLLAALLDEDVAVLDDIFFCENGSYSVRDRVLHDTKKYGWLSLENIIKYSSNIGAAKAGAKLGSNLYHRHLKRFGFGAKTGVALPGEAAGSLRHYGSWSDVSLATISFGQGISVTAVQLVSALSSIANGGLLMKPYVVKSVIGPDRVAVLENNPVVQRRVLPRSIADMVTDVMVKVTSRGGTGVLAAMDGFEVAGKTGTAQKPDFENGGYAKGKYITSFVGFVPARDPKLAILVMIDEADERLTGGRVAAPAFKEIATQSLSYLGIFPEERSANGLGSKGFTSNGQDRGGNSIPRAAPAASGVPGVIEASYEPVRGAGLGSAVNVLATTVPDFTGRTIRSVLRFAGEAALEVAIHGSGKAVRQDPTAGQPLAEETGVTVWFQ